MLLKALVGFDYLDFYKILVHIAGKRLSMLNAQQTLDIQCRYDLNALLDIMKCMRQDQFLTRIDDIDVEKWISDIEGQVGAH